MRLELETGQNMRKIFLLPLCISCVCSISACSIQPYEQEEVFIEDEEITSINLTNNPGNRCGVNGISCNDSALTNYTRTEADYREYGERTRRDHLYTQAAAGNNLTASIRPSIEDDIVTTASATPVQPKRPVRDDGVFQQTAATDIEAQPQTYNTAPVAFAENLGISNNIRPLKEEPCRYGGCVSKSLQDCEEVITSEFDGSSFDIADYIEPEIEEIPFTEVGAPEEHIVADINIEEVKIDDNTILTWEVEEGDNLRDLLTKWSAMSGWKLLWQTNRNYVLSAGVMFKGKFADVSSALVRAFARARPAPIATYYKGNRVIVVETMENENAY